VAVDKPGDEGPISGAEAPGDEDPGSGIRVAMPAMMRKSAGWRHLDLYGCLELTAGALVVIAS
jgi:hypothetical protein